MTETASAPLAISMGEPAGISTEILLKAYKHFAELPPGKGPSFYVIDDPFRVEKIARAFDADVNVATLRRPGDAAAQFNKALPVLPLPGNAISSLAEVTPGTPSPATAPAVIASIETAVRHAGSGDASGVVTLPIQKEALQQAGFAHAGHTDFIGKLTKDMPMPEGAARAAVMMLTAGPFRVVPATVHVPISEVPQRLTPELLMGTTLVVAQALVRDYGIAQPRIAMAGLNPHAGEGGHMGREEIDVIIPVIKALRERGIDVHGPFPADTMFHEEARAQYHAAIAMYHDQALIPIKTLAFYAALNTTLGLPIIRTSPDHGTALGLVGKGIARPDSLINAIYAAQRAADARAAFDAQAAARS